MRRLAWLKPYIDLNTKLRSKATNDADKNMFKLLNNAVFGKTCENLFERTDLKLVRTKAKALKLIAKPQFKHYTIYDEDIAGVNLEPSKVKLNKPSYDGVAILELSKILMYDFHYNSVKARYGGDAILLFSNTDSLKDEAKGKVITEFCRNRAKSYCYTIDGEDIKKCKGVKKSVIKKHLTIEDYKSCVLGGAVKKIDQTLFRSRRHEIHTEKLQKVALSPYDDKRVVLKDGVNTLPIGHWKAEHPDLQKLKIKIPKPKQGSLADLAYKAL